MDESKLTLAVLPGVGEHAEASGGTALLPGGRLYLALPESMVLNYAMSRVQAPKGTSPCAARFDIDPDRWSTVLSPADRFAVAHELAHLHREDHLRRVATASALVAQGLALGPLLRRFLRWKLPSAALASVGGTLAALLAVRAAGRRQELAADAAAADAGYALGGVALWRQRLERMRATHAFERPPSPLRDALESHPPALLRLRSLMQEKKREEAPSASATGS